MAQILSAALLAQERSVAITVDDLPYAAGGFVFGRAAEAARAVSVNRRLLAAFRAHRIPVTGFVIQKQVELLGPAGVQILKQWIGQRFDLGNHTYSHPDINDLTVEQIEEEIERGESSIGPLMKDAGKRLAFFRFPMNHSGDTKTKHDALAAFLLHRGYELASCTIDNSDYVFNQAYVRMIATKDLAKAAQLRREYIAYSGAEIDYYAGLNKQVFGYEPAQVMLLHDNALNAEVIEQLLKLFDERGYKFVSLAAAQSGPAYQTPDTYITKFGPMWGYRWANERQVKVDGRLEPDPPRWISDYGKQAAAQGVK